MWICIRNESEKKAHKLPRYITYAGTARPTLLQFQSLEIRRSINFIQFGNVDGQIVWL